MISTNQFKNGAHIEVDGTIFRIDCPGSAAGIEDEIAEALGEPLEVQPLDVPGQPAFPGQLVEVGLER